LKRAGVPKWIVNVGKGEKRYATNKSNSRQFSVGRTSEAGRHRHFVGELLSRPLDGAAAGQKTFASPEDASNALVAAAQNNDERRLLDILGPDGQQIVSSGDDTEDANNRANFVARYQEMHRLVKEPDGTTTLYIGAENWPTPIPLVNSGTSWFFDTESGEKEIFVPARRRDEISTIRVCEELAAADKEYYASQNSEYAEKIISDEGQPNGLYWKVADGAPAKSDRALVAAANVEGYTKKPDGAPTPYRGYYFRTLTRQGKECFRRGSQLSRQRQR